MEKTIREKVQSIVQKIADDATDQQVRIGKQ